MDLLNSTAKLLCFLSLHSISCLPAFRGEVHPYAAQPYVERNSTKGRHAPVHLTAHVRRSARRRHKQKPLSTIIIHIGELFYSTLVLNFIYFIHKTFIVNNFYLGITHIPSTFSVPYYGEKFSGQPQQSHFNQRPN